MDARDGRRRLGGRRLAGSPAAITVHIGSMSTNLPVSVGLSAETLRKTVSNYRASGSPKSGPGTADTETLCATIEILASRLETAGRFLSALQMMLGPTADLAATISAATHPPADEASARVAALLNVKAPVLLERPVFGHPDMTAVSHASIDEVRETFSCNNYLVHGPTGSVHEVRDDEDMDEAALRLKAGVRLSAELVHRDK